MKSNINFFWVFIASINLLSMNQMVGMYDELLKKYKEHVEKDPKKKENKKEIWTPSNILKHKQSFSPMHDYENGTYKISLLGISNDNKYLATAAIMRDSRFIKSRYENKIIISNIKTGQQSKIFDLGYYSRQPRELVFTDKDNEVIVVWDEIIELWNVSEGKLLKTLLKRVESNHDHENFQDLQISVNGKFIIFRSSKKGWQMLNLRSGKKYGLELDKNYFSIKTSVPSNTGKFVVTDSEYFQFRNIGPDKADLHDFNGDLLHTFCTGDGIRMSKAFITSDDKFVVTGSADKTIRVWNIDENSEDYEYGECIHVFKKAGFLISVDTKTNLLIAQNYNEIKLIHLENGKMQIINKSTEDETFDPIVSPYGNFIIILEYIPYSHGFYKEYRVFDIPSKKELVSFKADSLIMSRDGMYLVIISGDTIDIWQTVEYYDFLKNQLELNKYDININYYNNAKHKYDEIEN